MGEYFFIVNPAKRQYLDAGTFGENLKRSGIMRGKHAAAVGLLLCDSRHRDGAHHLFGSWAGDPIVVTGDNSVSNSAGVQTSTASDPSKNLYQLAHEEFEDISVEAMLMLIADNEDWADEFASSIEPYNSSFLIELGQLVFKHNCEPVRKALERAHGPDWLIASMSLSQLHEYVRSRYIDDENGKMV